MIIIRRWWLRLLVRAIKWELSQEQHRLATSANALFRIRAHLRDVQRRLGRIEDPDRMLREVYRR